MIQKLTKATIRDVAQAAGVSQSTVSRVLNKNGYVSADAEARVLEAVKALHYSPSAIAVGLSKSRSNIIGVVVPQIFAPFFSELFYVADKIAERHDYRLLLCNSDSSVRRERKLIEDLLSYQIAALFIAPIDGTESNNVMYLNRIRQSGTPVVCVDRALEGIECDGVYIDNFNACYEITRDVLSRGYRNILYMADPPVHAPGRQRWSAFQAACAEFGVRIPQENILFAPIEEKAEREEFLRNAMRRKTPPKAVINLIAGWDAPMLQTVISSGLHVPDDVFLTGLDDFGTLQELGCGTHYSPSTAEMATIAANLLMERVLDVDSPLKKPVHKALVTHLSPALRPGVTLPVPDVEAK